MKSLANTLTPGEVEQFVNLDGKDLTNLLKLRHASGWDASKGGSHVNF